MPGSSCVLLFNGLICWHVIIYYESIKWLDTSGSCLDRYDSPYCFYFLWDWCNVILCQIVWWGCLLWPFLKQFNKLDPNFHGHTTLTCFLFPQKFSKWMETRYFRLELSVDFAYGKFIEHLWYFNNILIVDNMFIYCSKKINEIV